MKKPPPIEDIIQTDRLPAICPACGRKGVGGYRPAGDAVYRLSCGCGWSAKYALTPEVR